MNVSEVDVNANLEFSLVPVMFNMLVCHADVFDAVKGGFEVVFADNDKVASPIVILLVEEANFMAKTE